MYKRQLYEPLFISGLTRIFFAVVEINESYWLLLADMPTFMAHKSDAFDTQVHTWEKEQQTAKDKPITLQSAQKPTASDSSDFSWYLEKFPDLQKRDD